MAAKKDFTQVAHSVFLQAIGEADKPPEKSATAVKAGALGGAARRSKLPPEERRRIATDAAKARWKK